MEEELPGKRGVVRFWPEALLLIASILVTVFLFDVVLHFTGYRDLIRQERYPRDYFQADSEMGVDIAPNRPNTTHYVYDGPYTIWSNSLGCFDREYTGETPYIYLTGDSFTWGFSPYEKKWGSVMERELSTRVVKCGVSGIGTAQELIKTKRHLAVLPKPKVIVVGYTVSNDAEDDTNMPQDTVRNGYRVHVYRKEGLTAEEIEEHYRRLETYCIDDIPAHPTLQRTKCWLYTHSVIYNMLRTSVRPILARTLPSEALGWFGILVGTSTPTNPGGYIAATSPEFEAHLQHIQAFKDFADSIDVPIVFVLIPPDSLEHPSIDPTLQQKLERVRAFMTQKRMFYVDLDPLFSVRDSHDDPLYLRHDGHWSVRGEQLAGLAVSDALLGMSVIEDAYASRVREEIQQQIEKLFPIHSEENL